MSVHPRSDWTSTKAANSSALVVSEVDGTAVHWNGPAVPRSAFTDPRSYLEGVRRFHVGTNGWSDIAYNLAVDQTGDVWVLRGLGHRSAANGGTDVNRRFVAVLAIIGEGQTPTAAMLTGLRQAVGMVQDRYPKARRIVGHNQIRPEPTACPGPDLRRAVTSGALEPSGDDVPLTDAEIEKIATVTAKKILDDREAALVDRVRKGVQGELGDENLGEFSDRIATKVAALIPTGGSGIDVPVLVRTILTEMGNRLR